MMLFGSSPSRDNPSKKAPSRGKLPLGPGLCWVCWLTLLTLVGFVIGCGGPSKPTATTTDKSQTHSSSKEGSDTTGDPSVPAELGGPGFKGEGWTTVDSGPLGDTAAKPGGAILSHVQAWPENLRTYGTGANTFLNSIIESLCFESLCSMHPETLKTIPNLASHWKISEDNMKFTFRIDPRAQWSDGKPVVADDVLATFRLIMDDTLIDPNNKVPLSVMNEPKVLSKYMFEVACKRKHWRNFMTFSAFKILPSHEIKGLSGTDFIKKYNFQYPANSGPYVVHLRDIKDNESITVTRRKDYWGNGLERNKGLYNFERIRFVVISDHRLAFDKICKGELDFYPAYTAKWWVEEITGIHQPAAATKALEKPPLSQVQKGWLVAQKVFTRSAEGIQGNAYNMRRDLVKDRRVRLALAHLFDRKKLIEKFAYNEYEPLKSYFPGGDGENPSNKLVEYDPQRALELLKEAGFTERDVDGTLMRKGERLSVTLIYDTQGFEKYYTAYQEACRKVGVEIKLDLVDDASLWKKLQHRSFTFAVSGFTGSLFPEPRPEWASATADQDGSNNVSGFKNAKADEIIDKYDQTFDAKQRNALLRELDGVIFNEHPYMLHWYIPCQRILWWQKFGMPKTVFTKYGDWRDVYTTWWYDPVLAEKLKTARKSGESLQTPEFVLHPWGGENASAAETAKK